MVDPAELEDAQDLEAVAARAAAGDGVAFTAFVRATQADVRRACASLVDPQSADDLAQETYVRAYQALRRYDGSAAVRTWLLGIARNVCVSEIRSRVRRRRIAGALRTSPLVSSSHAGAVDLWLCVARLPYERREAFVLTQVLGFSYEETAVICRCPIGTVRSRVARARRDLVAATSSNVDTTVTRRRDDGR